MISNLLVPWVILGWKDYTVDSFCRRALRGEVEHAIHPLTSHSAARASPPPAVPAPSGMTRPLKIHSRRPFASRRYAPGPEGGPRPSITHTGFLNCTGRGQAQFFTEIIDSAGMDEYSRLSRNASVRIPGTLRHAVLRAHRLRHLPLHASLSGYIGYRVSDSGAPSVPFPLGPGPQIGVHGYLLLYAINSRNSFQKIQAIDDLLLDMHGGSDDVARVPASLPAFLPARRTILEETGKPGSHLSPCL